MVFKTPGLFRLAIAIFLVITLWALALGWRPGFLTEFERENLVTFVDEAGRWGPILIVGLTTLAVVASPLPGASVALAAGAMYGHFAGTIYVVIGTEIGAAIAFLITRNLGRGTIVRTWGDKADFGIFGSQIALTIIVFVSRLISFVSFEAVSYAAGLSKLHFRRFLLATLAGILPASFLLAHAGASANAGNFGIAEWLGIGLAVAMAVPLLRMSLVRGKVEQGS
jgi:uncharacterized membrane protein YdjX (TVP38/TMEM64 family)